MNDDTNVFPGFNPQPAPMFEAPTQQPGQPAPKKRGRKPKAAAAAPTKTRKPRGARRVMPATNPVAPGPAAMMEDARKKLRKTRQPRAFKIDAITAMRIGARLSGANADEALRVLLTMHAALNSLGKKTRPVVLKALQELSQ